MSKARVQDKVCCDYLVTRLPVSSSVSQGLGKNMLRYKITMMLIGKNDPLFYQNKQKRSLLLKYYQRKSDIELAVDLKPN